MRRELSLSLILAMLLGSLASCVHAADPDAVSPLVSYVFLDALTDPPSQPNVVSPLVSYLYHDSLAAPPEQPNVVSPVVSYLYYDWPGDANLTFANSPMVSYLFQYPAPLAVTPAKGTAFGSIQSGGTRDRTFTLQNTGGTTISGTISVVAPFSVVGGNSYTLAPGQSKTVTVRFSPTAPGSYSAYLTFNNGSSWLLTAAAFVDFTATTGAITGRVTVAGIGTPLNGVTITAVGPGANLFNGGSSLGAYTGGSGEQDGRYAITGLVPFAHYHILASAAGQQFELKEIIDVAIVAGQTKSLDIALDKVINNPPVLTTETTPLLLVRGFGQNDYYDSTWAKVSARLKDPNHNFTEIWDCNGDTDFFNRDHEQNLQPVINGELGISDNASRLRQYITEKALDYKNHHGGFYPSGINIVTHSMGGLIVRQYLGGNEYLPFVDDDGQPKRIKVNTVVMLAPPNAGSYLADVLFDPTSMLGWIAAEGLKEIISGINSIAPFFSANGLPSPKWKSTQNLRTSIIRPFSVRNPWPNAVNLRLFAATGGSVTTSFVLNEGNNRIHARLRDVHLDESPEVVNDGAVTRPSVDGDYYEALSAGITIGGNDAFLVCRRSTFATTTGAPVPSSVTDVQVMGQTLDHNSLLSDTNTIDAVASVLHGSPWPTATQPTPQASRALASVSSVPMQLIVSRVAAVPSASVAQFSMVSDAISKLSFQLLADGTDVAFKLQDPWGNIISSVTQLTNPSVHYSTTISASNFLSASYDISNPSPGAWSVIVDGSTINEPQIDYLVTASGDSYVTLFPMTAALFNQGQDTVVICALADLSGNPAVAVTNAAISATVQLPDGATTTLNLTDDGLHNDGAPNDGVYAEVLPAVSQAGMYLITYSATGQNTQGQALQRVASGAFSVSSKNASLLGDPVFAMVDTDGDGVADALQAECGVNPMAAGEYILSGQLVDAGGTLRIAGSAHFFADGSGPMTASLFFDLSLAKSAGVTGDFYIENLQLFEAPSGGVAWLDTYHGSAVTQIQFGPVIITPPQTQTAVSGNTISFTVAATGSGSLTYQWQLSMNEGGTWVDLSNSATYAGVQTPILTLNGLIVAMNGYQFRAIVGNGAISTTPSPAATLTVTASVPSIAGKVSYYADGRPVPGVEVDLMDDVAGSLATGISAIDGTFSLAATGTGSLRLIPSKATETPPSQGVTTLDIRYYADPPAYPRYRRPGFPV